MIFIRLRLLAILLLAAALAAGCGSPAPAPAPLAQPPAAPALAPTLPPQPTATPRPLGTRVVPPAPNPAPATATATPLPAANPQAVPVEGALAPDFILYDLAGNEVALSSLRGRPVVLNFWATWCPPCRAELPALLQAYEAHQEKGLVVAAVNFRESPTVIQNFLREMPLPLLILLDRQGRAAAAYRVRAIPSTFFVRPDGIIASRYLGPMTHAEVEAHLQGILP